MSPTAKAPPGPTNLLFLCLSIPQHQPKEALPASWRDQLPPEHGTEASTTPLTSKLQQENFHAMEVPCTQVSPVSTEHLPI